MEPFKETRRRFEEFMLSQGHSKYTLEHYQWILSSLGRFMQDNKIPFYSLETGIFFEEENLKLNLSARHLEIQKLVIRRLNDFLNGEFYILPPAKVSPPDCYAKYFQAFLEDLRLKGLRSSTIQSHYYSGTKVLHSFYQHKILDLSEITPQHIYVVFADSNDKGNVCSFLRSFLRYLFKIGILVHDYSIIVPSVRDRKPTPSVYTKDETNHLLAHVRTNHWSGKRDYAIILLALRLGIRPGDIVSLKLSDINWKSNMIEFIQRKTCVPQRFELLPEVRGAFVEYLSNGRPETSCQNLFISIRPPFRPITVMAVTSLITRHMKKSGIVAKSRKYGGHALRMTLASELVSERVPYEVVRKILGHEDTKSMKHYVKFDVEMLRSCALETVPFSGLYAKYINDSGGNENAI